MTDEQTNQQADQKTSHQAADPWQEVGRQFSALGESLAAAFTATWSNPETQQTVEKMKTELNAAVEQISQKVTEASQSEEAKKVQAEFQKAAQTAQETGQQVYSQVQPELVSALRTMREEFDKLIRHMEQPARSSAAETPASEAEPDAPGEPPSDQEQA